MSTQDLLRALIFAVDQLRNVAFASMCLLGLIAGFLLVRIFTSRSLFSFLIFFSLSGFVLSATPDFIDIPVGWNSYYPSRPADVSGRYVLMYDDGIGYAVWNRESGGGLAISYDEEYLILLCYGEGYAQFAQRDNHTFGGHYPDVPLDNWETLDLWGSTPYEILPVISSGFFSHGSGYTNTQSLLDAFYMLASNGVIQVYENNTAVERILENMLSSSTNSASEAQVYLNSSMSPRLASALDKYDFNSGKFSTVDLLATVSLGVQDAIVSLGSVDASVQASTAMGQEISDHLGGVREDLITLDNDFSEYLEKLGVDHIDPLDARMETVANNTSTLAEDLSGIDSSVRDADEHIVDAVNGLQLNLDGIAEAINSAAQDNSTAIAAGIDEGFSGADQYLSSIDGNTMNIHSDLLNIQGDTAEILVHTESIDQELYDFKEYATADYVKGEDELKKLGSITNDVTANDNLILSNQLVSTSDSINDFHIQLTEQQSLIGGFFDNWKIEIPEFDKSSVWDLSFHIPAFGSYWDFGGEVDLADFSFVGWFRLGCLFCVYVSGIFFVWRMLAYLFTGVSVSPSQGVVDA